MANEPESLGPLNWIKEWLENELFPDWGQRILHRIDHSERKIMGALEDLQAAESQVLTVAQAALTAIQDLVANANPDGSVPAADVEAVAVKLQADIADLAAAAAADDPGPAPVV